MTAPLTQSSIQPFTLTLSRWHKVAERLSRDFSESVTEVREVFTQTTVSAYLGEEQERFLQSQTGTAIANLERAFRLQDALTRIRQVVGDANVREGVSVKLADFEKLNRRTKTLSDILGSQTTDMVTIAQLVNIPRDYVADGANYDSKRPKLKIRMLPVEAMNTLLSQLSDTKNKAYRLSDEIADLNRAKVTIALETEAATIAGLLEEALA